MGAALREPPNGAGTDVRAGLGDEAGLIGDVAGCNALSSAARREASL